MKKSEIKRIIFDYFYGITPKSHEAKVRQWLVNDTCIDAKSDVMNDIWDHLEVEDADVEEALDLFHENQRRYNLRHRTIRIVGKPMRWAAVLLLPLISAAAVWVYQERLHDYKSLAEFYVPEGKIDSLVLSDGSKVVINGGSVLLYPEKFAEHKDSRDVFLLGEGHFNVAKNPDQPFIVHSGNLNVKVLGTIFNVRAYVNEENITTTLEEGCVELSDKQYSEMMKPNEQIIYSRIDGRTSKKTVNVKDFSGWATGRMSFSNKSLGEILQMIGKRFDVHFDVDKRVNLNAKYTMGFNRNETIDDVMKVITHLGEDLKYTKKGNVIRLSK